MGFSLFSNNGKISYGIKNYIADTVEDLKNIPKEKSGNMVFVIEESKYYILNNNNTWTEKVDGAPEPEGTISITANGTTNVAGYAEANVNVPVGVFPSGQIGLTNVGEIYNVSNYASAFIDIPIAEESEF